MLCRSPVWHRGEHQPFHSFSTPKVLPDVQGGFNITKQAPCCTFFSPWLPRLWASFCHLRFLCPSPMALPVLCSKYAFQSGCCSFYFNTPLHPPPVLVQAADRRRASDSLPTLQESTQGRWLAFCPTYLISDFLHIFTWIFPYTIRNCSLNFTLLYYIS